MSVTLHRYSRNPSPGDLTMDDLRLIWGLMLAEDLVEVFFHDGRVRSWPDFLAYASDPSLWFYAARHQGAYVGLGMANNFSDSGNTAFVHYLSFAYGRNGLFERAGHAWHHLLGTRGGLKTAVAVLPGCYHGARKFAERFGFERKLRLPGALLLHRKNRVRQADACVYIKEYGPRDASCEAPAHQPQQGE